VKVILDMVLNGTQVVAVHFIDCDPAAVATIDNPAQPGLKIRPLDALALLNGNKGQLDAAGWLTPVSIPGVPKGTTRWDMVVNASKDAAAPAELKALNLTAVAGTPNVDQPVNAG
jgi:hypothetical protein